jgi:hypothetical protein
MKRLAIVVLVLIAVCGAAVAESQGFSIGAGALAMVPVFAPGASGFGGGISVVLPSIPLQVGLSVSTVFGGFGSIAFDAEYRLVERSNGATGWYLGAGGMALVILNEGISGFLGGVHLPAGFEFRPPALHGVVLVAELGLMWLPICFTDEGFVFTPVYLLARPWLGVRWQF